MGSEDPVAGLEILDPVAYFDNFAGDFVAQNQRGFFDAVPFHQVAAANPARPDAHQQFAGCDLWNSNFFQAYVPVIIVHGNAHRLLIRFRVSGLASRVGFKLFTHYFWL